MTKKQKTDELTPEELRELEQLENPTAGTAGDWGSAEEPTPATKAVSTVETTDERKKRLEREREMIQQQLENLEDEIATLEEEDYLAKVKECADFLEARGVFAGDVKYYIDQTTDKRTAGTPIEWWPCKKFATPAGGITLITTTKTTAPKKAPAPPKFKNPATGETHSGRGQLPVWLKEARDAGKLEEFRIK